MSENKALRAVFQRHPASRAVPDERQAGLREALRAVLRDFDRDPTEEYLAEVEQRFRAALAAQLPAQEERLDVPEGWEWQCAGCHRPVAPMGMCETCGVFGIMRAAEYRALAPDPQDDGEPRA